MTVTYTAEVATCRGFGCFLKLLFRWRGSIYKLVWLDLVCFLLIYYILNITYRAALNDYNKQVFEGIVKYCAAYSNLIPLSFVLGFYVSIVMTRWWNQYTSIPWPDTLAVFVSANIQGQDERGRLMRRTVMRYVCLCFTMVLTNISPKVKKRFPTLQHLVDAGLLVENELYVMEHLNSKFPRHSKHWMPIVWAASIITRARKEGRIRDDFAVKTLIDELNKFRGQAGLLISYDTISVPLVYTQVVTLAVYSFFLTSVMGQQWVENKTIEEGFVNMIDLYFPIFTTLQFFFYMGWLKVAESLINPFGEDDDDFEVNWIVDRNLQVSYMIVDEMHHEHPELIKDQYWDEIFPTELPYTLQAEPFRETHPEPSTAKLEPKLTSAATNANLMASGSNAKVNNLNNNNNNNIDMDMVGKNIQTVNYKFPSDAQNNYNIDEADDDASGIHFTAGRRVSRRGSSASASTIVSSLPRVNTVTNVFKRLFSKDESRLPTTGSVTPDVALQSIRLPGSASSVSIAPQQLPTPNQQSTQIPSSKNPLGSMRLTDQVIQEVDEQLTITSMQQPELRPTVFNLFHPQSPAQHSEPIDVPTTTTSGIRSPYTRTQSARGYPNTPMLYPQSGSMGIDQLFSTSAPVPGQQQLQTPTDLKEFAGGTSIPEDETTEKIDDEDGVGTNTTTGGGGGGDDHFENLKIQREKERVERNRQKIVRTISTVPTQVNLIDTDILLQSVDNRFCVDAAGDTTSSVTSRKDEDVSGRYANADESQSNRNSSIIMDSNV